ncbi:MAG: YceI family protein [Polyangia bacterium]
MRTTMAFICTMLFAARGHADGQVNLSVKTDESRVTYHIVHKFHKVDGVSKKVEGRVRILPTGVAQVAIRVPVESFDSENVNRDEHMKETVEAAKFPIVEVKATGDGMTMPTTFPSTMTKNMTAQVTFHGISHTIEIPVTVVFLAANKVVATTSFPISLDAYKVARPSLLFVKIDDAMKLDASLTLVQ